MSDQASEELEQLDEKSEQSFQDCKLQTAMRIAKEMTRKAKASQLVINYMRGLFDQMRFGHGLLDPQTTKDASVELVLLLEDEEAARRIQPDLDEGYYHWVCSWMTSCAYDNLAEATGTMCGYNSLGMHECINDGIQVCRQTGKMECIKCFREYATDVYLAADDLAMVQHQCQSLLEFRKGTDDKDRRWSGHQKLAWIHLLNGNISAAIEELQQAYELSEAEEVYLKLRAKLLTAATLDEALILAGKERFDWDSLFKEVTLPEAGEWPKFELERAKLDALAAAVSGDFEQASTILTDWDRRLTEIECLKDWFEIRLRLIAVYLLADNRKRAEALAKGLEAKAHEAQDYITLRRLEFLLDPNHTPSPVPLLKNAASSENSTSDAETVDFESTSQDESQDEVTPLGDTIQEYMKAMPEAMQSDSEEPVQELLNTLLSHDADSIADPKDAAYLVHLSRFLVRGSESARSVWDWAQQIRDKFSSKPVVISVVADVGYYFLTADPTEFSDISTEDLEKSFRLSLSMDANHARNHLRAGEFFQSEGEIGEAERCFARAFRLDRKDPRAAQHLADVYRETERPRDALAALDMCLREGCDDGNVAWEAAMVAMQLEQHDAMLTYLNRSAELGEEQPWTNYYRGIAHLEMGDQAACLEALEREEEFDPPGDFHIKAYRACALLEMGDERGEEILREVLTMPLKDVDYLSMNGLMRIMARLWKPLESRPADDPLRQEYAKRLIQTGTVPDSYFDTLRELDEIEEEIYFYRIRLHQSLDESWANSLVCLPGQDSWEEYSIDWGVLAFDRDDAISRVMQFQNLCGEGAEVEEVEESEETYRDRPGVVWQGIRWNDADYNEQFEFEEE